MFKGCQGNKRARSPEAKLDCSRVLCVFATMPAVDDITPVDLERPFRHEEGQRWSCPIPLALTSYHCDAMDAPRRSVLRLYEDGIELDWPHSSHSAIASEPGHYSHWDRGILFSTTDGSDPNHNERQYTLRVHAAPPTILAFGTCHIQNPVIHLHSRGRAVALRAVPSYTYSPTELTQQIDYYNGHISFSDEMLQYLMHYPVTPPPTEGLLSRADIILFEISTPIEAVYEGIVLNRTEFAQALIAKVYEHPVEVRREFNYWLYDGVLRAREEARARHLENFLPAISDDPAITWRDMDIMRNVRGVVRSRDYIKQTLAAALSKLQKPAMLFTHVLYYTPDGRPLRWPRGFHHDIVQIGEELGVPVRHPSEVVMGFDPDYALTEDRAHYTDAMVAHLGDQIENWVAKVLY